MQSGKKIVLGLDTSGAPLLVVAQQDAKTVVRRRSGMKQERLLFPAVNSVLAAVGGTLQQVGRIFIVRGPGRFTGIRISLTFASMLKYLNHAEVRGATVFEVLKYQVEKSTAFQQWKKTHPNGVLGVVLHAFRQEYFLQIFDHSHSDPLWLSLEELQGRLDAFTRPLFLVGTGADKAPLNTFLKGSFARARATDCVVRPDSLLALAQQDQFQAEALEPLYLKPARFELMNPQ